MQKPNVNIVRPLGEQLEDQESGSNTDETPSETTVDIGSARRRWTHGEERAYSALLFSVDGCEGATRATNGRTPPARFGSREFVGMSQARDIARQSQAKQPEYGT